MPRKLQVGECEPVAVQPRRSWRRRSIQMVCFRSTTVPVILAVVSAIGCAHRAMDPTLERPGLAVVRVANSGPPAGGSCGFIISSDGLVVTTSGIIAGG